MLYVPITGDSSWLNRSVIMVFDLRNASGTIFPSEALVFRVTSSYYSALFEIESCDISSGDGKLYFNTNRRITNSNTNHDGVSYVDDYTFEALPVDAPTSAPTYTLRYHANGGTGTMADTVVTYGQATPISTNAFTRTGYTFTGYAAYRETQGQWRYPSGWYAEGSQPSGETKYLYKSGEKVSATTSVDGDVVHLYAQWKLNNYTVNFVGDDGTVLQSGTVSHGQTPTAPAAPAKASDGQYSYTFAGWSPAVTAATANTTYTATYTATPLDTSTAIGQIGAYLERVISASELEEGVPYVISDYKDSWLHYVLTGQAAEKVSGSKTHKGFLLDGEPSADATDLWYIKDGNLVYGAADSDRYLLISYDSSNQGNVVLGSYDAAKAAYVTHYWNDDFAVRSTTHFLNRYGGTATDFVAAAYTSAGGSYWHFDRLHEAQTVKLTVKSAVDNLREDAQTVLNPVVQVEGVAANNYTLSFTSSDSAVASVTANGTVTALKEGKTTITATLTAANGRALTAPVSVEIPLTVTANKVSASGMQNAALVKVESLQTGVPYVITERVSGAALTGTMLYKTDADYKGLNSIQGLKTVNSIDLNNAPVWYYDGTHLLYGSATGSDNYLVYNASKQVALGTVSETSIFDKVTLYSAANKTFNIFSSNVASTTSYCYLNQMGGANYNVAGLYSSAYYSQWYFSQLLPQRQATLTVNPGNVAIVAGETTTLNAAVTVDGSQVSDYSLIWSSSDDTVAMVNSNGLLTAVGSGEAVITAELVSAGGRTMSEGVSVAINVQVNASAGYTATAVQAGKLVKVDSLQTGVPYVITEYNTGATLTGSVVYTTDADYHGLSGTEGLKLVNSVDLNNAPVWYYDGTHLLYGSTVGSDNYLVYNASNQVALGTASEANIFNKVMLYSAANKTFTIYPSAKTSGSTNYYLNQLGGSKYNAAGLYHYASTSQWHFSELVPEKVISLNITPGLTQIGAGETAVLTAAVTVNGASSDFCLTWTTSNSAVATVENGVITAVSGGDVTVTVTLVSAAGDTLTEPLSIEIPLTVVS